MNGGTEIWDFSITRFWGGEICVRIQEKLHNAVTNLAEQHITIEQCIVCSIGRALEEEDEE